jgi:hypothetical protein
MSEARRAVTSNSTGAIYWYGRTDFTGQFDSGDYTQYTVNEDTSWVDGVPSYYHKVVSGALVEMSSGEKSAVDTEREAISNAKLEAAARIGKKFVNLADLPVPPKAGLLVAIENVGGSWGFAYSRTADYVVFQSDGTYTPP